MQPTPITIKYLVETIKTVAANTGFIKQSYAGAEYNIDENLEDYPALWVDPLLYDPQLPDEVNFVFQLGIFDLVEEEPTNEIDVLSRCGTMIDQFITSLIEYSRANGLQWRVTSSAGKELIRDNGTVAYSGWLISLQITARFQNCL